MTLVLGSLLLTVLAGGGGQANTVFMSLESSLISLTVARAAVFLWVTVFFFFCIISQ